MTGKPTNMLWKNGLRVLSAYTLRTGEKYWMITEAPKHDDNSVAGGILMTG